MVLAIINTLAHLLSQPVDAPRMKAVEKGKARVKEKAKEARKGKAMATVVGSKVRGQQTRVDQ
jgi:hypothetical protein